MRMRRLREITPMLAAIGLLVLFAALGAGAKDEGSSASAVVDRLAADPEILAQAGSGVVPALSLPPDLDLESAELTSPRQLLKDNPALKKLLGEAPVFIYDPSGRPDPMLIPWTRARVMFEELMKIAEKAMERKEWDVAEMALQRILSDLIDDAYQNPARAQMDRLHDRRATEPGALLAEDGGIIPADVRLPAWVKSHTSAVVFDTESPVCLVGTYVLREGDPVPQQRVPVTVDRIEPNAVHYRVYGKTFVVPIEEGE